MYLYNVAEHVGDKRSKAVTIDTFKNWPNQHEHHKKSSKSENQVSIAISTNSTLFCREIVPIKLMLREQLIKPLKTQLVNNDLWGKRSHGDWLDVFIVQFKLVEECASQLQWL